MLNEMSLDEAIRARKTEKFLGDIHRPLGVGEVLDIEELLELAMWAPFHKPANERYRLELPAPMPWRCYYLDALGCRALLETLKNWAQTEATWLNGKIPNMLATASALLQVTWLPNPASKELNGLFEATRDNMEHIAAASAAIQNLLLATTARGIPSYWSSGGGTLLKPEVNQLLNIPQDEILLGSLLFFPQSLNAEESQSLKVEGGSWRHKRGDVEGWARQIQL